MSLWSQQKLWGLTETKDIETWEKSLWTAHPERFKFIAKITKNVHKKIQIFVNVRGSE